MTRRTLHWFIVLAGAVFAGACDRQPLTMPTLISSSAAVSAPREPLHVRGVVVDRDNQPVAGARVTPWTQPADAAVSDARGAFDLVVPVAEGERSYWVTVDAPGYETSELIRSVEVAEGVTLRLHRVQSVIAGESLRSAIDADDTACGYHWGFLCRRVRVTASTAGALTLDVQSDGARV